jgi:Ca2+/H+ antiporter, TMEM165/GDT1 family
VPQGLLARIQVQIGFAMLLKGSALGLAGQPIDQTGWVSFRNTLTAFTMVFPAELPDKSMFATLVLTSRFRRPAVVWCGVAAAFSLHVVVAVTAGSLIHRLPERLVGGVTALLFAVGAVLLWREASEPGDESALAESDFEPGEGKRSKSTPTRLRTILLTSFVTVGLAEWGDLTQLATASLAAERGDPVGVGLGAYVALLSVAALAAFAGRWIVRVVPLQTVRRIAAGLFAALAVWTVFELI